MEKKNKYHQYVNGHTSVETLATMLLLMLLGAGLFSLTLSGIGAYKRIYGNKSNASDLRVASSFITNKIRQNDVTGCLHIQPNPINGEKSLVIYEDIGEEHYATWIYAFKGVLYEALVLRDESPAIDISQPIVELDKFEISYSAEKAGIFIKVGKSDGKTYESFIKLRSKQVTEG